MSTLLRPFAKPASEDFIHLVKADGVRVWDDGGNQYIDGLGSLWFNQIGYGRPDMVDAIAKQLSVLPVYNNFDPFGTDISEVAAQKIASVSPFENPRVFLCCSGSESIDTAMKISRLLPQLSGDPERQIIAKRTRGYHGVNMGGTSAQGIAPNRENWGDLLPHMAEIDPDDIESAARLFSDVGSKVAAVICEPVQGAGGVFEAPEGYLERLRELCDANGALLIFDEVICGFGRTGNWFASDTYGVKPDMITFAKGVTSGYQPMGGVIMGPKVAGALEADPDYFFRHGYTYSGHPAGAAAAIKNIEIIEAESLVERANHVGQRLSKGLDSLVGDGLAKAVRGVGAIWALQLAEGTDQTRSSAIRDTMLTMGVICRPIGDSMAFCPPLVIGDDDVDTMVDVLANAISAHPL